MSIQVLKKCGSVGVVRPLIHGCSYENIRQAICKRLPNEYRNVLAELNSSATLSWYTDSSQGEFRSASQASSTERSNINQELYKIQQEIRQAIQGTEAAPYVEQVLLYPAEDAIFYRYSNGGTLELCISQWGYVQYNKPIPTPPPIPTPEPDQSKHILIARYSTGVILCNKTLFLCKQGYAPISISTDDSGCYDLEQTRLPNGSIIEVAEEESMQNKQHFILEAGQQTYEVTFPIYTKAIIKIRNQVGENKSHQILQVNGLSYQSDSDGRVRLEELDVGVVDRLEVSMAGGTTQVYPLDVDPLANIFVYHYEQDFMTQAVLQVVNQEGTPRPSYTLSVNGKSIQSDALGRINILDIPWTPTTRLRVLDPTGSFDSELLLERDPKQNIFEIPTIETFMSSILLSVVYPDDKPATDYTIQVEYGDERQIVQTDAQGYYRIDPAEPGQEIVFRDMEVPTNEVSSIPQRGQETVQLTVEYPKILLYHFYLIDSKKQPIKAQSLEMKIGKEEPITKITEVDGHFAHPRKEFSLGDKVTVSFKARGINGNKKERTFKLGCNIREGQDKYELCVNFWNKRWLWMILLVPLFGLLAINYNREVRIQTVLPNGTPCSGVAVRAQFISHYLYKDGNWFTTDTLNKTSNVGPDGVLTFKDVGMSGFSHIFYMHEELNLHPSSECLLAMDSVTSYKLHWTLPNSVFKIRMREYRLDLSVRILDQETGEPVNNALVYSYFERDGESVELATKTNKNGKAQIAQIPLCNFIDSVRVERYGYEVHRSTSFEVRGLIGQKPNLTINLKPNKKRITFFVRSSETKEPLPEASVILTFAGKSSEQARVDTVITNVDGMGTGFFDDLRMTDEFLLKASCVYFKDGTFGNTTTVQEFLGRDAEARTVYLEPEKHIVQIQHVDADTGAPISGVINKYTLGRDPATTPYKQISNANGKINVRAKHGDSVRISIDETQLYEAFSRKMIIGRDSIIRLKPKMLSIEIEVIDALTRRPIPGSMLSYTPKTLSVLDQKNGCFTIQARAHDKLSLQGSHPDYKPTATGLFNVEAIELFHADKSHRQIPLEIPECTVTEESNDTYGLNGFIKEYSMGVSSGTFELMYDTDIEPDKIEVFDGRKQDIGEKKPLWQYKGATRSFGEPRSYKSQMITFHTPIISIRVTGKTIVRLIVNCPKK